MWEKSMQKNNRLTAMTTIKLLFVMTLSSVVGNSPHCPSICSCRNNFTYVDCDRKSLTEVPQDIPKSARVLILSHNAFGTMKDDFFPKLPNLNELHLAVSHITGLAPHSFRGLPKLQKLFLISNSIGKIDETAFCSDLPLIESVFLDRNKLIDIPNFGNCTHLADLTLENNEIHSLKFPDGYKNHTNLAHLTLSLNPVEVLHKDDFLVLSSSRISRLLLSRLSLKFVENGTFDPISGTLASLKLSYNDLNSTQLAAIFDQLSRCKALVSLNLDGVKFDSKLPPNLFNPLSKLNLISLSLNNNQIATIQRGTFSPLRYLIHLSLQGSEINSIEPTAFQGLNALQNLDISRNNLHEIPANLPWSLKYLLLQDNQITGLKNNELSRLSSLITLNLHKNSIQQLREQAFGGLKKLTTLDLSSNLIGSIPKKALSPLRHLNKLILRDNKLNKIIKNIDVFEQLKKLQYLDMGENACSTIPFLVFRNLTELRTLMLDKNRLKYQLAEDVYGGTFAGLENLETLNLEQNDIEILSPVIFTHLKNVKTIKLSHNRLTHWHKKLFTFTQKIQNLDLSYNKITIIDEFALGYNYSSFKRLNLDDNPFACTCDLVWFCRWATSNKTKVRIVDFANYTCDSPISRQGVKLKNFDWRSLICFDYYPYVIAGSVLGGIIVVTIIMLILYRCRWRISLCCYRYGQKSNRDANYHILNEKEYDAYISSVKKDFDFVQTSVLNTFDKDENEADGKYQLCFEPRNFEVGKHVVNSICESIDESDRAIVVLTNDYLQSSRHQMELDLLQQTSLERPFSLIFLTNGQNLNLRLLPRWLHRNYANGDFLEWNENQSAQEEFRSKLDRKLRRPPTHPPGLEESQGSDVSARA